jgi:flagellar biosynthesis protein FliQ
MKDPLDQLHVRFPRWYTAFVVLCAGGLVSSIFQWTTDSRAAAVIPYVIAVIVAVIVVGWMTSKNRRS